MATKKTTTDKAAPKKATATKKAPAAKAEKTAKAPKAAKADKGPAAPRHPKARADQAGGKASLAKSLAPALSFGDDSADAVEARLKTASNAQLVRLQKVVTNVKAKWGDRSKLIAAIGTATKMSTDKDYIAKLGTYSLPHLVDIAQTHERRARS